MKYLLDSSAWIEYFIDGAAANKIAKYVVFKDLVVPSIVLYEVYRQLYKQSSPEMALQLSAQLEKAFVVPIESKIAYRAAELSLEYKLGTADAMILAVNQFNQSTLITLDNDFRNIPDCLVLKK